MVQLLTPQRLQKKQLLKKLTPHTIRKRTIEAQKKQDIERQNTIREIEKSILNTSSVNESINLYNSLDIQTRNALNINPTIIQSKQIERINVINSQINKVLKNIQTADEDLKEATDSRRKTKYRAERAGSKAELIELKKLKVELDKGIIFDIPYAKNFAQQIGQSVAIKSKARETQLREQREETLKIVKKVAKGEGDITKISYKNGKPISAIIDGQRIDLKTLTPTQTKGIELTAIKRDNINKINIKLQKGQVLTATDFKKAEQAGVTSKELLGAASKSFKIHEELKQIKLQQQKVKTLQESNINKSFNNAGLNFITKVFTNKQKNQILNNLTLSDMAKIAGIEVDKTLTVTQKETAKRKILNISQAELKLQQNLTKLITKIKQQKQLGIQELRDSFNIINAPSKLISIPEDLKRKVFDSSLSYMERNIASQRITKEFIKDIANNVIILPARELNRLKNQALIRGENGKAALFGTLGLALGIPAVAIKDIVNLAVLVDPQESKQLVTGLVSIVINKNSRNQAMQQINTFKSQLRSRDVLAMSEIFELIMPAGVLSKGGKINKLVKTNKVLKTNFKDLKKLELTDSNLKIIKNVVKRLENLKPQQRLELLKDAGVKIKDARGANSFYKDLKDRAEIDIKIKDLDKKIIQANREFKTAVKTKSKPKFNKVITKIETIAKTSIKIKKLKPKTKPLTDITKAKKLGEFFKKPRVKQKPKVSKTTLNRFNKTKATAIRTKNSIINKINRIESKLKNKDIDSLTKQKLLSEKRQFKNIIKSINDMTIDILRFIRDRDISLIDATKLLKKLTQEIKYTEKLKKISDKLNKLETKIKKVTKEKNFNKSLNLVLANQRDKIFKLYQAWQKVGKMSLTQLGSFEKKIDNTLSLKLVIKEFEPKKIIKRTKTELNVLRKEYKPKKKQLSKQDINNMLIKQKHKKTLDVRIKEIDKTISNLKTRSLLLRNQIAILPKTATKNIRVSLVNIEGIINTMKLRKKQLIGLKNKPLGYSKEIEDDLFLIRKIKDIKTPKIKTLEKFKVTAKETNYIVDFFLGDISFKIEANIPKQTRGLKNNKKARLRLPSFKVSVVRTNKKYSLDSFKTYSENKLRKVRKTPAYKNYLNKEKQINNYSNRVIDLNKKLKKKKLVFNKTKTKLLESEINNIKSRLIDLETSLIKALTKLSKTIILNDMKIDIGQIQIKVKETAILDKIDIKLRSLNKNINKLDIKLKPIKKPKDKIEVPKRKKLKKVVRKPIKPIRKPVKPIKVIKVTKPIKPKIEPPKPIKIPKFKFNFDSTKLNNRLVTYEAKYRERRNKLRPFNKRTNPIITKTIRKTTTRNRMLNTVAQKVDNSLVRSMTITVKGITKRKVKDVKKSSILSKFNQKKSKNTPVLELVEKPKSLFDTKGEKREAKIKRLQKKTKPKKKITKNPKNNPKKITKKRKVKKKTPSKRVRKVSKFRKVKKSSKTKRRKITKKKAKKKIVSKKKTKK